MVNVLFRLIDRANAVMDSLIDWLSTNSDSVYEPINDNRKSLDDSSTEK